MKEHTDGPLNGKPTVTPYGWFIRALVVIIVGGLTFFFIDKFGSAGRDEAIQTIEAKTERIADRLQRQLKTEQKQVEEHRAVSRCAFAESSIAEITTLEVIKQIIAGTADNAREEQQVAELVEYIDSVLEKLAPPANSAGLNCDRLLRTPLKVEEVK